MAAAWFDSMEPGAAGPRPAAAPRRQPAGHAAGGQHHARIAPAQRLDGGAAHRRDRWAEQPPRPDFRPTSADDLLISKPVQRLPEIGQPLPFLVHHRGRRARHETLVAQLGLGLDDFALAGARSPCPGAPARRPRRSPPAAPAAARRAPPPARLRVAAANAASSASARTSASLASAFSSGRGLARRSRRRPASAAARARPGDRFISLRRLAAGASHRLQLRHPGVGAGVDLVAAAACG